MVVDKTNVLIDYAMPLITIERMAKQAHDLCLDIQFGAAKHIALQMMSEAGILSTILTIMQEDEEQRK